MRIEIRASVGDDVAVPAPCAQERILVDDDGGAADDEGCRQHGGAPRFPALAFLLRPAGAKVAAVQRVETCGKVGPFENAFHRAQAFGAMRQPCRRLRIGLPFPRRALQPVQQGELDGVVPQPVLQQRPLAQQRFVRRLYGRFAGVLRHVRRQEPLLHQEVDQRSRFCGNFGDAGDAPARRLGVGIDARKPRDQAPAQQGKPRLPVARNARILVRRPERALDAGLDGAGDPAELHVMIEGQPPRRSVFLVEPLERERQQRQRVL